jgi:DnaJ-class molecular chaperone
MLGSDIDVLTLSGMVELKVPPLTGPGTQFVMKGKGIKGINSIKR